MELQFRRASRKATPMLLSVASVSGGGKTYSALLLAAGIAGDKGRVGFIDTENGRGEMYSDSPGIIKALPGGYDYIRMDPPFSPERYVQHLEAAQRAGITVCIIDSATHEWEGIGGCVEIAEKNLLGKMPNWSKAKMAHKRFVNYLLTSSMHLIFCLRARDKVKVFKKGDMMITDAGSVEAPIAEKDVVVPIGLQAITEKSFIYEMLVSLMLEEKTHYAVPVKVPEPLVALFPGKKLITKEDGARIRQWNETGSIADSNEQLFKRARFAAEEGVAAYRDFFKGVTAQQRKVLEPLHAENKAIAERVDQEQQLDRLPDPVEQVLGMTAMHAGKSWTVVDSEDGYRWVETSTAFANTAA